MQSVLMENGFEVNYEADCFRILNENAVNNPDLVATMLVNAGCPPTLLKVDKEDLEMYFLRVIKENGGFQVE